MTHATPTDANVEARETYESCLRPEQIAEAKRLRELLAPYAGCWVALSFDWMRVIAADPDHATCVEKARTNMRPDDLPYFCKVRA
jgi:hypothetical protein